MPVRMLYPRVLRHFRLCRAAAPLLTVTMVAAAAGRLLRGRRAARQCGALLRRSNSVLACAARLLPLSAPTRQHRDVDCSGGAQRAALRVAVAPSIALALASCRLMPHSRFLRRFRRRATMLHRLAASRPVSAPGVVRPGMVPLTPCAARGVVDARRHCLVAILRRVVEQHLLRRRAHSHRPRRASFGRK